MEMQQLHATAYKVFRSLCDLNPNFMKELFYRSLNLTQRKKQSLCSFLKHKKVWKQKFKAT